MFELKETPTEHGSDLKSQNLGSQTSESQNFGISESRNFGISESRNFRISESQISDLEFRISNFGSRISEFRNLGSEVGPRIRTRIGTWIGTRIGSQKVVVVIIEYSILFL